MRKHHVTVVREIHAHLHNNIIQLRCKQYESILKYNQLKFYMLPCLQSTFARSGSSIHLHFAKTLKNEQRQKDCGF